MTEKSNFAEAKNNTELVVKKIFVTEDHMTEELNLLAKQALFSAKMEVFIAEAENIPYEQLSKLAQKVYGNPQLAIVREFTLQQLHEDFTAEINHTQTKVDDFGNIYLKDEKSATVDNMQYDSIDETFKSEETNNALTAESETKQPEDKPIKLVKKKTRREWSVRQIIDLDECEVQIEIVRPRMRNPTTPIEKERTDVRIK